MKVLQWNQTLAAKFNRSVLFGAINWNVLMCYQTTLQTAAQCFAGCEDPVRWLIPKVSDRQMTESSRCFWNWRFLLYVHVCHIVRDTYCDWNLCIFLHIPPVLANCRQSYVFFFVFFYVQIGLVICRFTVHVGVPLEVFERSRLSVLYNKITSKMVEGAIWQNPKNVTLMCGALWQEAAAVESKSTAEEKGTGNKKSCWAERIGSCMG